MPSPIAILSLVGAASALAVQQRPAEAAAAAYYYYFPLDFEYGVDSRFTSNLTFGTYDNPRPVKMVMDTGSANTWTWAPNSTMNWGSKYLATPGPCNDSVPLGYEPARAGGDTLTNKSVVYAYAGNAKIVSGHYLANDTVTPVGGNAGVPNAQFALVDYGLMRISDNGTCTTVPAYDKGILGLAPTINDTTLAAGPVFRKNAYLTGALASEVLFMWMDRFTGALGDTLTGGMLLSAIDTSKYTGPLVRVQSKQAPSTVGPYILKPNVTFDGVTSVPDGDYDCLVDSGAHNDVLPFTSNSDMYAALFNQTGGKLIDYFGILAWNGTCDTIPTSTNVTYHFAAKADGESIAIDIPLRNFARGWNLKGTEGMCLLNLEYDNRCILGATFLTGATLALDDQDNSVALAQGGVSVAGSGVDESALKTLSRGQSFDS